MCIIEIETRSKFSWQNIQFFQCIFFLMLFLCPSPHRRFYRYNTDVRVLLVAVLAQTCLGAWSGDEYLLLLQQSPFCVLTDFSAGQVPSTPQPRPDQDVSPFTGYSTKYNYTYMYLYNILCFDIYFVAEISN